MTDFIINSEKVKATQISKNIYILEITDNPDGVLAIQDRPKRKYNYINNSIFANLWNTNQKGNSFSRDPPNAVIDFRNGDKSRTDIPVKIVSTKTDGDKLKMRVVLLPGVLGSGVKEVMRNVVIWVDPWPLLLTGGTNE